MNEIQGDIREAKQGFIIQGCNSRNAMGSGLAKAIMDKWPDVKKDYHERFYHNNDILFMGENIITNVADNLYVASMITQEDFGGDGALYVNYCSIQVGLMNLMKEQERNYPQAPKVLHSPLIGCGLAGGSWNVVSKIISKTVRPDWEVNVWRL